MLIRCSLILVGVFVSMPALAQSELSIEERIAEAERTERRFGWGEAVEKQSGSFRLATYNVQNLFDDQDDPEYSGDVEDLDDEKPRHELIAIARAIREVDADVLCLQEIESIGALELFRDEYLADLGYEHVVSLDAGGPRGIEQAVLSRFPLGEPANWPGKELGGVHPEKYGRGENWYAGEPIAFRRSPMLVEIRVPTSEGGSMSVTLVVIHHKSGFYNNYWREAESRALVALLGDEINEMETQLVALGDFNATPEAESVRTYLEAGLRDVFVGASEDSMKLVTHESGRRIDLMLMTQALSGRVVEGSARVLGTAARPEDVNWRDLPSFIGYGSDHYPVSIDLWVEKPES